jgi:hypothetical protein
MQQNALVLFSDRPVTEHFASCTGVVTWSVTFSGEHRLRVAEHGAQREIFGPKREEVRGGNSVMERVMICTVQHLFSGNGNKEDVMGRKCDTHGCVEKFIPSF